MKRLLITTEEHLKTIKHVRPDIVHFRNMGDIHPFKGPVIRTDTAVFENCNKNFIYYWATSRVLPKLQYLYLFSHPCEPDVFRRLNSMGITIYMDEQYGNYYGKRWAGGLIEKDTLKILDNQSVHVILNEFNYNSVTYHN